MVLVCAPPSSPIQCDLFTRPDSGDGQGCLVLASPTQPYGLCGVPAFNSNVLRIISAREVLTIIPPSLHSIRESPFCEALTSSLLPGCSHQPWAVVREPCHLQDVILGKKCPFLVCCPHHISQVSPTRQLLRDIYGLSRRSL